MPLIVLNLIFHFLLYDQIFKILTLSNLLPKYYYFFFLVARHRVLSLTILRYTQLTSHARTIYS